MGYNSRSKCHFISKRFFQTFWLSFGIPTYMGQALRTAGYSAWKVTPVWHCHVGSGSLPLCLLNTEGKSMSPQSHFSFLLRQMNMKCLQLLWDCPAIHSSRKYFPEHHRFRKQQSQHLSDRKTYYCFEMQKVLPYL